MCDFPAETYFLKQFALYYMLEAICWRYKGISKPTMLDYMNEDCWRAVLDYVPIRDIIRTERASRCWQRTMLAYLREVRICIESRGFRASKELHNIRKITKWDIPEHSFERWTHKLGTSVVAIYCVSQEMLKIISNNCPHIEALTLYDPEGNLSLRNQEKNFDRLRMLSFERCYYVSDQCISDFIGNKALEALRIRMNEKLTGEFLINIESRKLKSLTLDSCKLLQPRYLQLATQRFNELKKLELIELPSELYEHIPLLLANLPKLEFLRIIEFEFDFVEFDNYYTSICKLSSLKRLYLHVLMVTDIDLHEVARCCKELCSLDIKFFSCSGIDYARALALVCMNAGPRLTTLGFTNCIMLTDDDILACIRICPVLTSLDVSSCTKLTPILLAKVAAMRREMRLPNRLRLFVHDTSMETYYGMDFKELIVDRCQCLYKI